MAYNGDDNYSSDEAQYTDGQLQALHITNIISLVAMGL